MPRAINAAVLNVLMPVSVHCQAHDGHGMHGVIIMPAPGTSGNRPLIKKVGTVVLRTLAMISLYMASVSEARKDREKIAEAG